MPSPYRIRTAPTARARIGRCLALCALLTAAGVGCGPADHGGAAGTLLGTTDGDGRHYRQVDPAGAPEVGLAVRPGARGGWDVRLTLRNFRFSPAGAGSPAAPGRGSAQLSLDGRPLARLHGPRYHIPAGLLSRGTHEVTARLCADDRTVWAVAGRPVESRASLTAPRSTPAAAP
ncbi:hypothetical protein ACWCP6_12050 [Streptomyces sp. NPDC002004]